MSLERRWVWVQHMQIPFLGLPDLCLTISFNSTMLLSEYSPQSLSLLPTRSMDATAFQRLLLFIAAWQDWLCDISRTGIQCHVLVTARPRERTEYDLLLNQWKGCPERRSEERLQGLSQIESTLFLSWNWPTPTKWLCTAILVVLHSSTGQSPLHIKFSSPSLKTYPCLFHFFY